VVHNSLWLKFTLFVLWTQHVVLGLYGIYYYLGLRTSGLFLTITVAYYCTVLTNPKMDLSQIIYFDLTQGFFNLLDTI